MSLTIKSNLKNLKKICLDVTNVIWFRSYFSQKWLRPYHVGNTSSRPITEVGTGMGDRSGKLSAVVNLP